MDEPWIKVRPLDGGRQLITLGGPLDFATSLRLRLVLYDRLDEGCRDVLLDLSKARVIDKSAVGVLMRVHKHLAHRGGCLRAVGAGGSVRKVLEGAGAKEVLGEGGPPEPPPAAEGDESYVPDPDGWPNAWGFEVSEILHEMSQLAETDPRRAELRRRAIEICLPQTRRLAGRFRWLGESVADLNQVAAMGLVKAVNGYDPQVGVDFGSYALPTIVGELKRYFRDHCWGVRVPRPLQELVLEFNHAQVRLTQQLGRSPSVADAAKDIGVSEDEITQAAMAANAYRPLSLFRPVDGTDGLSPVDRLGSSDTAMDRVEIRESIAPAIDQLPRRDREILAMRFYGNMSQAQIGAELGISQMHVSRLLRRIFWQLRRTLLAEC
jgi:RNA polymerase sigma-70 factor (sigma-B/F/G subfamily)